MLRRLILVIVLLATGLVGALLALSNWTRQPLVIPSQGLIFEVEKGDSLGRIARRLEDAGVLRHPLLFKLLARASGADARLRRGEYRLSSGITPVQLLTMLEKGDTVRYLVTLPEGIRLSDALALLANSDALTALLAGPDDPRLLTLVAPEKTAEGFFLPETYQYQRGDSDLDILREAHRMMREALADAWGQRDESLPYNSPYEALIMASIIEKETGLASERPLIAGVFVRRLQRGMRLQTDPTVIYGLGETFDGNLQRMHLRDESNPYNTYRHDGLPPGPIALPGRKALQAAVQPAAGDALYFVARGDGSHQFSASLAEHEEAVRAYQLKRRANYRSTPESQR
jgi:UPF0755 protein